MRSYEIPFVDKGVTTAVHVRTNRIRVAVSYNRWRRYYQGGADWFPTKLRGRGVLAEWVYGRSIMTDNGRVYGSEIADGRNVFVLTPDGAERRFSNGPKIVVTGAWLLVTCRQRSVFNPRPANRVHPVPGGDYWERGWRSFGQQTSARLSRGSPSYGRAAESSSVPHVRAARVYF